jgi:hypothetical protein
MRTRSIFAGSLALAMLLAVAEQGCSTDVRTTSEASSSVSSATAGAGGQGTGAGPSGSTANGTGGATATSGTGSAGGCAVITKCRTQIYQCGDGLDNDGDGLIDSDDPDCLGACDNVEDSFFNNIPGTGQACKVDCYFDSDIGSGNDDCHWSHMCDPNEVSPGYHPESYVGDSCAYDPASGIPGSAASCADLHATQSPECHTFCGPLVPNGCDCFGCCELPAGSGKYAWSGSKGGDCTLANALDPAKCEPCEPVPGCINPCDACEICIGKGAVAPGCSAQDQCAPGIQPCGLPGQDCCPSGTYCVTGCCQPTAL